MPAMPASIVPVVFGRSGGWIMARCPAEFVP
jgi:hypothetical protein